MSARHDVKKWVHLYKGFCTLLKKENPGINSKHQCHEVVLLTPETRIFMHRYRTRHLELFSTAISKLC